MKSNLATLHGRLAGNLGVLTKLNPSVTLPNVIEVRANDISIDLNGFHISSDQLIIQPPILFPNPPVELPQINPLAQPTQTDSALTISGGLIPGPGTPGPIVPPGPAPEPDDVRRRMSVCPDQASSGSEDAINSYGYNLSVSNGTIWGMPDDGIQTRSDAMIRNVRVLAASDNGITMQRSSIVTESIADDNEDVGFVMDAGTLVSNCTVHDNGTGIPRRVTLGRFVGARSTPMTIGEFRAARPMPTATTTSATTVRTCEVAGVRSAPTTARAGTAP